MRLRILTVFLFSLILILPSRGQEEFKFKVALESAAAAAGKKRAILFDKYAVAVERVQAEFQKNGDLASTIAARGVAKKAREQRILASTDIAALKKLGDVMQTELAKIRLTEAEAIAAARTAYIDQLNAKAEKLTRKGQLDQAVSIDKTARAEKLRLESDQEQIAALKNRAKPTGLPSSEPIAAQSSGDGSAKPVKTPLTDKEPITGDLVLEPGLHRLKDKVTIGIRGYNKKLKKEEEIPGDIESHSGTEISGGGIYLHCGTFKGNETKFDKVRLSEELQGKWTLKSCLLDECTFRKDGGWESGPYSARWDFENCVFEGTFFDRWGSMGLKLVNCSFHGIKFHPFNYKKDVGKEATSDGRRLIDCVFVDCTVPASTALATDNCLFRNCKFTKDMGENPKVETEIETVIYYDGDTEPDMPKLPDGVRLIFKPASELGEKKVGSDLRYTHTRGRLEFE